VKHDREASHKPPELELSVVLCTHNRAHLLPEVISSLSTQSLEPDRFEILVIDNASIDDTRQVVSSLCEQISNLRYEYEAITGLSFARNSGIQRAAGRILCFIDDDAIADSKWLEHILRDFQETSSMCALGGPVLLAWPSGHRPDWIPSQLVSYYSQIDLGSRKRELSPPEYPFGTNMAMRRSCALAVGGFNTSLGRRGKSLMSGEERDFFLRLQRDGCVVAYNPDTFVTHRVQRERLSRTWLMKRVFAQGRFVALNKAQTSNTTITRASWARWGIARSIAAVRVLSRALITAARHGVLGQEVVEDLAKASRALGAAFQAALLVSSPGRDL
jgi:glycosyltransferase involved in cell wall biosynthesis